MKRAIIIHGKPSREKFESPEYPGPQFANWLPWAGKKLEEIGYVSVAVPTVNAPYEPSYDKWNSELDKLSIDKDTLIIGHSFGASALLQYVSTHKNLEMDHFVAVAPWYGQHSKYPNAGAPIVDIDLHERIRSIDVLYDEGDSQAVQTAVAMISETFPKSRVHNLQGYGHFLLGNTMPSVEFPELIEVLGHKPTNTGYYQINDTGKQT